MQGKHVFQPRTETVIDLKSFIAEDHFLRKVDRVLEMSFVRDVTAACYAVGMGRSSIDPEVFFRMLLVAYLYNIISNRRLCEEVRYNLAYRWFCRLSLDDEVPRVHVVSTPRDFGPFVVIFPNGMPFYPVETATLCNFNSNGRGGLPIWHSPIVRGNRFYAPNNIQRFVKT